MVERFTLHDAQSLSRASEILRANRKLLEAPNENAREVLSEKLVEAGVRDSLAEAIVAPLGSAWRGSDKTTKWPEAIAAVVGPLAGIANCASLEDVQNALSKALLKFSKGRGRRALPQQAALASATEREEAIRDTLQTALGDLNERLRVGSLEAPPLRKRLGRSGTLD